MIPGEWSAGPIGAMHPRRQPDNQEPRRGVTERGHRLAVVIRVAFLNFVQEPGQARAGPAVLVEY